MSHKPFTMRKLRGFTLIELLIVMAILAILTVIGLANFQSARIKARDAKRKSDLQTISKSLEAYVNDHGSYPAHSGGKIVCNPPDICDWGNPFSDANGTIYSATLPVDDLSPTQFYYYDSNGTSFTLYALLENTNDPSINLTLTTDCRLSTNCNYKITSSNIQ